MSEVIVVLHNIRSAHNVGSIFRTADAAGVLKIYLTGYTPTPIDRFGRVQKEIAKTALGAHENVCWEKKTFHTVVKRLKEKEFSVVSVEQDVCSVSLYKYKATKKVAYIFGNEVRGLSKQILDMSDTILEIPMHGKKESLNVSVSAGIVLFNTERYFSN